MQPVQRAGHVFGAAQHFAELVLENWCREAAAYFDSYSALALFEPFMHCMRIILSPRQAASALVSSVLPTRAGSFHQVQASDPLGQLETAVAICRLAI